MKLLGAAGPRGAEEPFGVGTPYTDGTRLGPIDGEVSAFEPPHRVAFAPPAAGRRASTREAASR